MSLIDNSHDPREPSQVHLNEIHRIAVNDPQLRAISVGDILRDNETAVLLAEALRGNTNLKRIIFREHYNMDHAQIIISVLPETRVAFCHVAFPSNMYAMSIGEKIPSLRSLLQLDISGCFIGPTGAISLATILESNNTLLRLTIPQNRIRDEGTAAIAHMLQTNRRLREITLDSNEITAQGQKELRDAIFDDSSFSAIKNSNHIMQSYFYNPRAVFGKAFINDILSSLAANLQSKTSEQAVTRKLKRVLKKKYGVKLQFESFLNMDVGLLPHVLGWISEKCCSDVMYQCRPILINLLMDLCNAPF
jgi:hypothetical protein